MSIRMIADELRIPQTQLFEIVSENLTMRKVCAKLVPRVLSEEQKVNQKAICQDLLHHVHEGPDILGNVMTIDEARKRQSSEWHILSSPCPEKSTNEHIQENSMLICFFDRHRVIHKEFIPLGQTVNVAFNASF